MQSFAGAEIGRCRAVDAPQLVQKPILLVDRVGRSILVAQILCDLVVEVRSSWNVLGLSYDSSGHQMVRMRLIRPLRQLLGTALQRRDGGIWKGRSRSPCSDHAGR